VHRCAAAAVGSFLDRLACALTHPAGTAAPRQETTEKYSSAAPTARQPRTAPLTTRAGPCSPPGSAAPGSISGLAGGRGSGYGILVLLTLIVTVSVLLPGY